MILLFSVSPLYNPRTIVNCVSCEAGNSYLIF